MFIAFAHNLLLRGCGATTIIPLPQPLLSPNRERPCLVLVPRTGHSQSLQTHKDGCDRASWRSCPTKRTTGLPSLTISEFQPAAVDPDGCAATADLGKSAWVLYSSSGTGCWSWFPNIPVTNELTLSVGGILGQVPSDRNPLSGSDPAQEWHR